jgi:E3 UFM1-protein ligase 1
MQTGMAVIDTAELSNDESSESSNKRPVVVTAQDATALIKILLERGYFHKNVTPVRSEDVALRERNEADKAKYDKGDALLIEKSPDSYIMVVALQQEFTSQLKERGRWNIQDAADFMGVSAELLRRRIVPCVIAQDSLAYRVVYAANGDEKEMLTAKYISDTTETLWATMHQSPESGIISVTEAADSFYSLPIEMALDIVDDRISSDGSSSVRILLKDNASKVLVTTKYLERLNGMIAEAFRACTDEPVEVKTIAKTNGWEISWVLRMVKDLSLPGEFHGETYVPSNFTESKRRSVIESFATNGYITSHMCHTMFAILPSQMKDYVTTSTAAADSTACLVLKNSVVHKYVIVDPLIEAVQEAAATTGWLDLQLHLPVELLEHQTDDARTLVEDFVLAGTAGVACVQANGALYFSQAMIDGFTKNNLPDLIKTFAKTRADELLSTTATEHESGGGHTTNDEDGHMTGKEKRKTRKASKSKHAEVDTEIQAVEYGTVSLDDLVKAVVEAHPDLSDADSSASVLAETCKLAFCTDKFDSLCGEAVRTELDRLRAEKKSSVSTCVSRIDTAIGDFSSVEAAFIDPGCFATSCYMIQAKAKFLVYACDSTEPLDDETKAALKRDFLTGCCADFTCRVTQYALVKNGVDEGIFSFWLDEVGATRFYAPVDLAVSSYGKVHLSCAAEKAGQRRDPLPMLREELLGSAGVALARQWILCGGECYQGGVKPSSENDGEAYTRPGDVDAFLAHVRENCLAICGLPFSNLDKKSEKKFLNARRQRLAQLLDEATDAGTVLDLRIMLLYQLVKNMVVSGPLLRGPIVRMLAKERKVSESVSAELLDLADKLEKGEEIDAALLERVKDCALMKNKTNNKS